LSQFLKHCFAATGEEMSSNTAAAAKKANGAAAGVALLQPPTAEQSHRLLGNSHQKARTLFPHSNCNNLPNHPIQTNGGSGRKVSSSPSPSDNEFGNHLPMSQSKLSSRVMFSSESVAFEPDLEGGNGSSSDMMVGVGTNS
jgi:hypothetical protein